MLNKVNGVVIRTVDYGEGNKILRLYTEEKGKLSLMARGAKKVKSRHAAVSQLFTLAQYTFFSSGSMGTLNHGEIIRPRSLIREDLVKTAFAAYVAELVDRTVEEQEASPALFRQLNAAIDQIEEGKDPQIIAHIFEFKMLQIAGYTPIVDQCAGCGKSEGIDFWSPLLGGCACKICASRDTGSCGLPEKPRKLMRLFRDLDLSRLGNINVSPETGQQLKTAMRLFMDTHLPVQWKTRKFIDQMDGMF